MQFWDYLEKSNKYEYDQKNYLHIKVPIIYYFFEGRTLSSHKEMFRIIWKALPLWNISLKNVLH